MTILLFTISLFTFFVSFSIASHTLAAAVALISIASSFIGAALVWSHKEPEPAINTDELWNGL